MVGLEARIMQTVAIIGGGFSGTLAAVNLVRLSKIPLRIFLINHGYPLGRGVAYGTKRPEHLLNVAARNMSALADDPNHFVEWLGTRFEFADVPEAELREQFVPRGGCTAITCRGFFLRIPKETAHPGRASIASRERSSISCREPIARR